MSTFRRQIPVNLQAVGLVAASRGIRLRWWLLWLLTWLLACGAARVRVPQVGPSFSAEAEPLQQLGAIGLCLPVIFLSATLQTPASWLLEVSPRTRSAVVVPYLMAAVLAVLAAGALVALVFPERVSRVHVVALLTLMLSLNGLASLLVPSSIAALPAPMLVVASTFRGVVPWSGNVVYNPEALPLLLMLAGAAVVVFLAGAWVALRKSPTALGDWGRSGP